MTIPGSWHVAALATLLILMAVGFSALLIKRPEHSPRIRVSYHPRPDDRDSLALFRRIMDAQRARLGI